MSSGLLRVGTRQSLLAIAQTERVAALMASEPGAERIQQVAIPSRGDLDLITPLQNVDDQRFFSAELDDALLNGDVDACVHALKDLPSDPARGITRIALPERANPRDVIVFRHDVSSRLAAGRPLRIGSSSARRQANIARFLPDALPHTGSLPKLEFHALRGPVDQRLAPLQPEANADAALDGVILALAGLERLWQNPAGRASIEPQLQNTRRMVLPLTECATAPGQGVLAIECRSEDRAARKTLAPLNDPTVEGCVMAERAAIAALPATSAGDAGATSVPIEHSELFTFVSASQIGNRVQWNAPERPTDAVGWDGAALIRSAATTQIAVPAGALDYPAVFVAHWRAATPAVVAALPTDARIWVSGVESWRQLARRGLWVEGCADNLGFEILGDTLKCGVLQLPLFADWCALTSRNGKDSWRDTRIGHVVATFERPTIAGDVPKSVRRQIRQATHFFWGSAEQFALARRWVPDGAQHACGIGKTASALADRGLEQVTRVPSRAAWRAWLN